MARRGGKSPGLFPGVVPLTRGGVKRPSRYRLVSYTAASGAELLVQLSPRYE